jgi:hypothetical protein
MCSDDCIIAVLCRGDAVIEHEATHPHARLVPSDVVTLARLHPPGTRRTGVGPRACFRGLRRDELPLVPALPHRTGLCGLHPRRTHPPCPGRRRFGAATHLGRRCERRERPAPFHARRAAWAAAWAHRHRAPALGRRGQAGVSWHLTGRGGGGGRCHRPCRGCGGAAGECGVSRASGGGHGSGRCCPNRRSTPTEPVPTHPLAGAHGGGHRGGDGDAGGSPHAYPSSYVARGAGAAQVHHGAVHGTRPVARTTGAPAPRTVRYRSRSL